MTTPTITDPVAPPVAVAAPTPAAPAPMPVAETVAPATPDPIATLASELAALRADLAALKEAKPAPVAVPPTDQGKPTITPITIDHSSLPPIARMAAGYRK